MEKSDAGQNGKCFALAKRISMSGANPDAEGQTGRNSVPRPWPLGPARSTSLVKTQHCPGLSQCRARTDTRRTRFHALAVSALHRHDRGKRFLTKRNFRIIAAGNNRCWHDRLIGDGPHGKVRNWLLPDHRKNGVIGFRNRDFRASAFGCFGHM